VIGALILGFLAGAIARLVVPDVFSGLEGWRSWVVSTVLGLCGAALGWLIFTKWLGIGDEDVFDLGGLVGAIIGTIILLPIAGFVLRRTGQADRLERGAAPAAGAGAAPTQDRERRGGGRRRRRER
jgi:uncharacterized membrane protein YeaQ/YmgE (transglycosylase-associated protein family)